MRSCAEQVGTVVEIVEKMLIGIGPGGGILGERLEDAQIPLRGLGLVEAPLDHGELVVSGSRIAADLDISSEQVGGFRKFLVFRCANSPARAALRRNRDSRGALAWKSVRRPPDFPGALQCNPG